MKKNKTTPKFRGIGSNFDNPKKYTIKNPESAINLPKTDKSLPLITDPYQKSMKIFKKNYKFIIKKGTTEKRNFFEKQNKEINKNERMIEVLDYDEAYECLNDLHYSDKGPSSFTLFNKNFNKTKYADQHSISQFFSKYHVFQDLKRKGVLTKEKMTSSFSFIQASEKNLIVPNPTGLLRRKGDDNILTVK